MRQSSVTGRCVRSRAQRLALIAALFAVPGLAACEASARETSTREAPVRESVAQRHVIEIEGFAFRPQTVRVAPGDTVVWVNRDVVPHTATDSSASWDSGELQSGASWSLVAGAPAVSTYLCTLHPTMKGQLIIE